MIKVIEIRRGMLIQNCFVLKSMKHHTFQIGWKIREFFSFLIENSNCYSMMIFDNGTK